MKKHFIPYKPNLVLFGVEKGSNNSNQPTALVSDYLLGVEIHVPKGVAIEKEPSLRFENAKAIQRLILRPIESGYIGPYLPGKLDDMKSEYFMIELRNFTGDFVETEVVWESKLPAWTDEHYLSVLGKSTSHFQVVAKTKVPTKGADVNNKDTDVSIPNTRMALPFIPYTHLVQIGEKAGGIVHYWLGMSIKLPHGFHLLEEVVLNEDGLITVMLQHKEEEIADTNEQDSTNSTNMQTHYFVGSVECQKDADIQVTILSQLLDLLEKGSEPETFLRNFISEEQNNQSVLALKIKTKGADIDHKMDDVSLPTNRISGISLELDEEAENEANNPEDMATRGGGGDDPDSKEDDPDIPRSLSPVEQPEESKIIRMIRPVINWVKRASIW